MRRSDSLIALFLLGAAALLPMLATHDADPAGGRIRLRLPDDTLIADFLRALEDATGERIVWNPLDKNSRGKRVTGAIDLRGSRQRLLEFGRALLTFYELKMEPFGCPSRQVQRVVDNRHTCGLPSYD